MKFMIIQVEVNGWWEWPPATITREIAVKNRSHNLKQPLQNNKVSFSIKLTVSMARGGAYMKLRQINLSGSNSPQLAAIKTS